jgi:hypothetical protein
LQRAQTTAPRQTIAVEITPAFARSSYVLHIDRFSCIVWQCATTAIAGRNTLSNKSSPGKDAGAAAMAGQLRFDPN